MKKWQSPTWVVDREVWSISPPDSGGSGQLPRPLPAALHSSSSRRLPLSPGEKISSTGRSGRRLPRARRGHRASASSQGHPLPANERGGTAVACLSGFENPRAPSNAIRKVRRIAGNRWLACSIWWQRGSPRRARAPSSNAITQACLSGLENPRAHRIAKVEKVVTAVLPGSDWLQREHSAACKTSPGNRRRLPSQLLRF